MIGLKIIFAILYLLAIIAGKLAYDLRLYFRRSRGTGTKTVNHALEWCIVAVLSVPAVYIFQSQMDIVVDFHLWGRYFVLDWELRWLVAAGMAAAFIWIFFDGPYNLIRGYHWGFTGSVDSDDAKTDIFLRWFPPWLQQVIKWVLLGGAVIIYILNFK